MAFQTVFKRYELKYLITSDQKNMILEQLGDTVSEDSYGRSLICNLYLDTDNYRLIRHSVEKPVYKEKLRIRSYGTACEDSAVFVELKKKYDHVVYKRRAHMTEKDALSWLTRGTAPPFQSQITREIDYFRDFYGSLSPKVHLSYKREAYFSASDPTFRITFDTDILCRFHDLTLTKPPDGGRLLLPHGTVLMELKCAGGIPLRMVDILSRERIYKTSFSKYGTAYNTLILPELKEKKYVGSVI